MPFDEEKNKIDFRVYIGILFFRWQVIAVCFLYCLLAGVLYIHLAPKVYRTRCRLMIYRDPKLQIRRDDSPMASIGSHIYLLQSWKLRSRVVERLIDDWAERMGSREKMMLPVMVRKTKTYAPTLNISVDCGVPQYGYAFLTTLLEEHRKEWQKIQMESSTSAAKILEDELYRLEGKIEDTEDDIIEYQRLHDIARVQARASMESSYLHGLMFRRSRLRTELMLLEAQYPLLTEENALVINDVNRLTRETGAVEPVRTESDKGDNDEWMLDIDLSSREEAQKDIDAMLEDMLGWQNIRVKLARLQQQEKELLANMDPRNPQVVSIRKQIADLKSQLELGAEIELARMRDRHKAIQIQLDALETAEYKWQSKNLLASQRASELQRLQAVKTRYVHNFNTLYARLHDMRVSEELESEHLSLVEGVGMIRDPVWPDPMKILVMALALGLGSGLGIALLAQTMDNKIQSIKDVEEFLGIPFLGGVPFWVHSGLERAIRPIVTEEHASGAVEAYRALRTSILAALKKINEKILIVTSADSREGKTLTALNMAIMVAQMGYKVLLVDMDMRRGRLHRSLGLEKAPGMTDALREDRSLKEVTVKTRVDNLYLIPTGSAIENSAEIMQSCDLVGKFVDVQDDYDYIIMDTSPVLRVTDTVILATQGPGVVLYVARVNHTPKPLIRYSLDMLRDARVLGLVMNSIELHKISSLYYSYQYPNYAYYSNAYAYGYSHYHYGDGGGGPSRRGSSWSRRKDELRRWFRKTFLPME